MAVLLVCIHLLACLVALMLMKLKVLKSNGGVIAFMLFVPVWGMAALIVLEWHTRRKKLVFREVDVDRLLINDEIHRSILMDEDELSERVVPLGEAFVVNDAATQRELMMDVMYSNPSDYVAQLQEARMNDDTEVVHYAVTALVEMQKDYDLEFQRLDRQLALHPEDDATLNEYLSVTERYLGSGLISGSARAMTLRNFSNLLAKKLQKNESASLWAKKIDADLSSGDYEAAYEGINRVLQQWPRDERGYLFLLRYHALVRDSAGIKRVLEMIRKRGVFLSPEGRSTVAFWSGTKQDGDKEDGNGE